MYTLLYLKWMTSKVLLYSRRNSAQLLSIMWQPGWEEGLGEDGYMYMFGWVPLLSTWNYGNIVISYVCVHVQSLQSCLTLCSPMDCSPKGSSLSVGFSRQEYWSGLPCLPPGDLSDPGIKPRSPALQAYYLLLSHRRSPLIGYTLI